MTIEPREIAAGLSEAQRHVVGRASDAEDWSHPGRGGCPRLWHDLVAHRYKCSFATVRALIRAGLMFECEDGYGLTPVGLTVQMILGEKQ